jgi:endo-1,4-beta-D-glucanase Y
MRTGGRQARAEALLRGRLPAVFAGAAAVLTVAAAVAFALSVDSGRLAPPPAGGPGADPVERFFARYVSADGRVVRHDQGGDTVGEGQAYAMLMAVASDDRAGFESTWSWARDHLRRDDGLLAHRWAGGRVVDADAASDADLDAAHALILAASRFDTPAYRRDGLEMASAILEHETVRVGGQLVLVAGTWAQSRRPVPINPSYFSPRAFAVLAEASGDRRWTELRHSSSELIDGMTATRPSLAPDWAQLGPDASIRPAAAPSDEAVGPRFGFDAVRVPLRWSWACDARERRLAARPWDFLRGQAGGGIAPEYGLDGKRLAPGTHPASTVAGAAAAHAAGEAGAAGRLLARAAAEDRRSPSYYGAALVALGHLLLETDSLNDGC